MSERREIDLHKMTREQARETLVSEIQNAHLERRKHLCFVHGRGWHSKGKAVLAKFVREWLVRLEHHPRSPLERVRFGEEDRSDPNPGVVLVDLKLHRRDPVFDPDAPAPERPRSRPPRPGPRDEEIETESAMLEEAEEEMRRLFDEGRDEEPST